MDIAASKIVTTKKKKGGRLSVQIKRDVVQEIVDTIGALVIENKA
jgi:hypothetical protein